MSKNQSVEVFNEKSSTSGIGCEKMTSNRDKPANSYGPRIVYARSYAQVLTDCHNKAVTNKISGGSKTKGVNLERSITSVVNGQNSF